MKKKICFLFSIVVVLFTMTSAIINSGPSNSVMVPYGVRDATGNPANIGEGNCTGCHSGTTLNSGGSLKIVVKDDKGNAVSTYDFNKLYTVDITVARTNFSTFGFDAEVVTKNNTDAGLITSMDTTKIISLQGDRSTNMTHFTPGKTKDAHTFSFKWKTPLADSGSVTIYAAGLAANGNGKNTGDYTYTSVKTLSPISSTFIKESKKEIESVSVYPNPVSNDFNLNYYLNNSGEVSIVLYSLNGQKIADLGSETKRSGDQREKISLPASVKDGAYLLQLRSANYTAVKKVMVSRTF
jgi:hypothetical protein